MNKLESEYNNINIYASNDFFCELKKCSQIIEKIQQINRETFNLIATFCLIKEQANNCGERQFYYLSADYLNDDFFPARVIILSFLDCQKEIDNVPHEYNIFMKDLLKLPTITLNEKKAENINSLIPKKITFPHPSKPVSFILSEEFISGLKGLRNPDHLVPLEIIKKYLKKKVAKLRKEDKAKPEYIFFFKIKGGFVKLIIRNHNQNKKEFVILTCYYTNPKQLMYALNLNPERFELWAKNLATF